MESINISFSANRQTLTGGGIYCASNTVHYIIADFELGDGWDGFDSVRAVWSNDFKCISTVLDPNGSCTVPHEVLERRGKVSVNLVGSILEDDELTDRLTTYPLDAIHVDAEARIEGEETAEVTPSQFEQYIEQVQDLVDEVKDIDHVVLTDDYMLVIYYTDGTQSEPLGPIRGAQGEQGPQGPEGPQGPAGEVTLAQLAGALPTDSASGAIASFPDGSDLFNYLSCIAQINPVQDLHGYNKPWSGGAGKNKLQPLTVDDFSGGSVYGLSTYIQIPFKAGTYTISSNAPTGYIWAGKQLEDSGYTRVYEGTPKTVTLSSDGVILFGILTTDMETALSYNSQIEVGSSATTWQPYSNICPISGWTGCEVDKRGKNLLDPVLSHWSTRATAYKFINGVVPPNTLARITLVEKDPSISLAGIGLGFVYNDLNYGSPQYFKWVINSNGTILDDKTNAPTQGGHEYLRCENVFIYPADETAFNKIFAKYDVMVELGSTATSYEPYNPNSAVYNITWQTEAGTVYGGTLDIVSGVLTVDKAIIDLGSLSYTYQTSSNNVPMFTAYPTGITTGVIGVDKLDCEAYAHIACINASVATSAQFPNGSVCQSSGGTSIRIRDDAYTDATVFKTAVNGYDLVYPLATPQTYQLTPVQVACLLGQNNVWANCGDIDEVKYKADVQRYIEKKLGE